MLQAKMFSEKWYQQKEFVVPLDKKERVTLRLQLETESHMGRMFVPGGEKHLKILLDRLNMIELIDAPPAKTAAA